VGDTDNGSVVNLANRTITVDLDPGENISVTFVNVQEPPIVIGPDKSLGSQPVINIINSVTGALLDTFLAYEASYIGGVRIATGDLNSDGTAEIVTAPGRNHVPLVRVFSQDGTLLTEFLAFDSGFLGGVDVAVGDVDGDGRNDIIAGQSFDGSAVRVFRNVSNPQPAFQLYKGEFFPFGAAFRGGVVVAAADMGTFSNGTVVNAGLLDGIAEVIVGNEAGMRSTVSVLDYTGPLAAQVRSFLPLANDFRGGVSIEIARVDGDTIPDIIVGAGNRGDSIVEVRNGLTGALITTFAAFTSADTPSFQAPIHIASLDSDSNGIADSIVVVQGSDGASRLIRFFDPITGQLQRSIVESDPRLAGAYFVAALNNDLNPQILPELEPSVGMTTYNVVNGDLVIEGDGGNDVVDVTGTGASGVYVVTTLQGSQTVSGVVGNILVNLHGGNDHLTMNQVLVSGKISISTEGGNDAVRLGNSALVSSGGNLEVDLGADGDSLTTQRLYIAAKQIFNGGDGDDQIALAGSYINGVFVLGASSGGATTVSGGAGSDNIEVRYSFIVGQWTFDGGQGNDNIKIDTSACSSNVTVVGGTEQDVLIVDTNYFLGTVVINGNAGNDQLRFANSLGMPWAVLLGEEGSDWAGVANLTTSGLQLDLGGGTDTADIRGSSLDQFFAQLGEGNDSITLFGNLVRSLSDIDGGGGSSDRLLDLGNSLRGTVHKRAFELFA
jgi:hypothetical protein